MNTSDYLLNTSNAEAMAFITKDVQVSYGLYRRICTRLVDELSNNHIEPGDRLAMWGENTHYWAAAYLAIMKIGAVAVPISTLISADDFRCNMTFAGCKLVFVDKTLYKRNLGCCSEFPSFTLDDRLLEIGDFAWEISQSDFNIDSDAAINVHFWNDISPTGCKNYSPQHPGKY